MIRPATALLTGLVLITTTAGAQTQPAANTPAGFAAETMLQFEASMEKFIALAEACRRTSSAGARGPG